MTHYAIHKRYNQRIPAQKTRGKQALLVESRMPENAIARSAIQIKGVRVMNKSNSILPNRPIMIVSIVLMLTGLIGTVFLNNTSRIEFVSPIVSLFSELLKAFFIAGTFTIFLQYYFHKQSELEHVIGEKRHEESLKELRETIAKITEIIASNVKTLDTLKKVGILEIYENRNAGSEAILNELQNKNNSSIRIVGISLRDFIKGDQQFNIGWQDLKKRITNNNVAVKLLLLNPCCEQAIYRAESEERTEALHRDRNLFIETNYVLSLLSNFLKTLDKNNALEIRIYNTSTNCFLMLTDSHVLVEQYYYQEALMMHCMPLVKYDIQTKVGKEMNVHFDYVWEKAKDIEYYIREQNIGVAESVQGSKIINIFLERSLLTERLKYLAQNVKGEILLAGNSLASFTSSNSFIVQHLASNIKKDQKYRLLLINPLSQQAKYRAAKESGNLYKNYTLQKHKTYRFYNDNKESISDIERLSIKYPIQGKLYSSASACFIFLTEESVFIEQYHYGQTEAGKQSKMAILSGLLPVIEYDKDSDIYHLMKDHFNYVWDQCSITLEEYETKIPDLENEFDSI
jgi:hypothetical protein